MSKLFAMEQIQDEKPDDLLIDKLTSLKKTEKEGISVTADLIKQRNELKAEIVKEIKKNPPEGEEGGTDDNQNKDPENKDDGEGSDNPDETKKPSEDNNGDDGGGEDDASNLDNLNNLVGSAKNGDVATESFRKKLPNFAHIASIFTPIKNKYNDYGITLESMNLQSQKKPINEQPVAYVKDEVLSSLNTLIGMAGRYVSNNEGGIQNAAEGVKKLMEQLTIYRQYHQQEKLHFTGTMVSKDDIKTALSVDQNSNIRETSGILAKYLDTTVPLINKLLTNKLEDIPSALTTSDFQEEGGTIDYKAVLPGFYKVSAAFTPFTNYMETDYENYQIFRLKTLKLQDLYKLDHIALNEDKDLIAILDRADNIIMSVGLTIDNLKTINDTYKTFIDKLKATVYEIEKGEKEKLSDLDLDEKMKDFIKYKLVTELYSLNISMGIDFLTSLVSAFTVLVELGE